MASACAILCAPGVRAGAPSSSPRPVFVPGTVAAERDGITSVFGHHAGLGFIDGFEAGLGFSVPLLDDLPGNGFSGAVGGRLGPIAMAIALSRLDDGAVDSVSHRFDLGLAVRLGQLASFGFGYESLSSDTLPGIDEYATWSLSGTVRPFRALAVGIGIDRIDSPKTGAAVLEPIGRFSLGLRPGSERVSFGLEAARVFSSDGGWLVGGSLKVMPIPGLTIGGYARYVREGATPADRFLSGPAAERVEWGAMLELSQGPFALTSSVDGRAATGSGDDQLDLSFWLEAGSRTRPSLIGDGVGRRRPVVVKLALGGAIPERPTPGLLSAGPTPFAYWLAALDVYARDERVVGLSLAIQSAPGWAQIWELRQAIERFQKAGKKVHVFLTMADMKTLYLASIADEVHLHPAGSVFATGLAATATYFSELLNKIGVNAQFVKWDEYKSAPERFTQTQPSEPAAKQAREISDHLHAAWMHAVSIGRGIALEELTNVLARGPQTMHGAKLEGLVDDLVADHAVDDVLKKAFGPDVQLSAGYRPSSRAWRRWGGKRKIVIVPAVGSIVEGESGLPIPLPIPFIGGASTGDASFTKALAKASHDSNVVGIVVRVSSPGGSALASDRMYSAVVEAAKKKPLIVSFGDVAASGGYYLAAGAPRILASPDTITGSIGIFTGKVDLSGLYQKIGLSTWTYKTAPRADMLGGHRPLTDEELQVARDRLRAYYGRFVKLVADGRNLTMVEAFARAKGQVFTGKKALDLRLIDATGGLWDAIEQLLKDAGLTASEPIDLVYMPTPGFLAGFRRFVAQAVGMVPEEGAIVDELKRFQGLVGMLDGMARGGVFARMPYDLEVR